MFFKTRVGLQMLFAVFSSDSRTPWKLKTAYFTKGKRAPTQFLEALQRNIPFYTESCNSCSHASKIAYFELRLGATCDFTRENTSTCTFPGGGYKSKHFWSSFSILSLVFYDRNVHVAGTRKNTNAPESP